MTNPWTELVKKTKQANPQLSLKEVLKLASKEYRSIRTASPTTAVENKSKSFKTEEAESKDDDAHVSASSLFKRRRKAVATVAPFSSLHSQKKNKSCQSFHHRRHYKHRSYMPHKSSVVYKPSYSSHESAHCNNGTRKSKHNSNNTNNNLVTNNKNKFNPTLIPIVEETPPLLFPSKRKSLKLTDIAPALGDGTRKHNLFGQTRSSRRSSSSRRISRRKTLAPLFKASTFGKNKTTAKLFSRNHRSA